MNYIVKHNPKSSRFEIDISGKLAYAQYILSNNVMNIHHTYTPPELRGRGIAATITKFALDYCKANGLKVIPECPYTHEYIYQHKEYMDLLASQ